MTVFLINKPILQILEDVLNRMAVKNEDRLILAVCITAIVACLISKVINVFLPGCSWKKSIGHTKKGTIRVPFYMAYRSLAGILSETLLEVPLIFSCLVFPLYRVMERLPFHGINDKIEIL